jgi:hypothetical protein
MSNTTIDYTTQLELREREKDIATRNRNLLAEQQHKYYMATHYDGVPHNKDMNYPSPQLEGSVKLPPGSHIGNERVWGKRLANYGHKDYLPMIYYMSHESKQ